MPLATEPGRAAEPTGTTTSSCSLYSSSLLSSSVPPHPFPLSFSLWLFMVAAVAQKVVKGSVDFGKLVGRALEDHLRECQQSYIVPTGDDAHHEAELENWQKGLDKQVEFTKKVALSLGASGATMVEMIESAKGVYIKEHQKPEMPKREEVEAHNDSIRDASQAALANVKMLGVALLTKVEEVERSQTGEIMHASSTQREVEKFWHEADFKQVTALSSG